MERPIEEDSSSSSINEALHAFFRLGMLAESISFELWQRHGLTLGQGRLLYRLREQPRVAGDLAKELGVRAASLTRMMERLESQDLVERKLDRTDRRRIVVEITPVGRDLLGSIDDWHKGPVVQALKAMSENERSQFTRIVDNFLDRVQDPEE